MVLISWGIANSFLPISRSLTRRTRCFGMLSSPEVIDENAQNMSTTNACRVAASFEARPFEPAWWGTNPHVMTIGGAGSLEKQLGEAQEPLCYRREFWNTPDGDRIAVDFSDAHEKTKESASVLVVMTHGLESRSNAPLTERMARAFNRHGFDVCVVSFRSCAHDNDVPRKPGGYHLGFTQDLNFVTKKIFLESDMKKRIYLSGFSLGGNVVLKLLGELGVEASTFNGIVGAAVTCVPFKPVDCAPLLSKGFNRLVYSGNFLKSLKPKASLQVDTLGRDAFPVNFDIAKVLAAESIGDFDDAFIAPIYGFKNKWQYYETQGSASGKFLQLIKVPALAVNALDDPFIESSTLPTAEEVGLSVPLRLVYHRHGGHCGFVSAHPPKESFHAPDSSPSLLQTRDWLPVELARFVGHCEMERQRRGVSS